MSSLDSIIANGSSSIEDLSKLANALKLPVHNIASIWDYKRFAPNSNNIILLTPDKKINNGHWVGLKVGSKGKPSYYFDSYGQPPPRLIADNVPNLQYNTKQIQALNHSHCGIYVLDFLKNGTKMLKDYTTINIYH